MMVVGCATVAGCSSADGEAAPVVTPVRPTAVTPSPSPTPTRPTGTDDAAAIATAQAYFAAFNEGLKTRNSKKFRALSTKACVSCSTDAATIDSLAKEKHTVEGGTYNYHLKKSETVVHRFGSVFVVFNLKSEAAVVKASDGRVVDRFEASDDGPAAVELRLQDGRWLVRSVNG
jgi:hypothetical protein